MTGLVILCAFYLPIIAMVLANEIEGSGKEPGDLIARKKAEKNKK